MIQYQSHSQPSWKSVCFCTSLKIRFRKTNEITASIVKGVNIAGNAALNNTVPFSKKFCFRSSSELQGEVDPI